MSDSEKYGLLPSPAACTLGSCPSLRWTGQALLSFLLWAAGGCFILRVEEMVLTSTLEETLRDSGFYSRFPCTVHSLLSSLTAPPHPLPLRGGFRFSACPWVAQHLTGTEQGAGAAASVWFRAQGDEHGDGSSGPAGPFRPSPTGGGGRGGTFHEVQLFHSTKGGDV